MGKHRTHRRQLTPSKRLRIHPFSAADLGRLLATCRSMPGDVAGIPARTWWEALCLLCVDATTGKLDATLPEIFKAAATCYAGDAGTIAIGAVVHKLHPRTMAALNELVDVIDDNGASTRQLFPWPFDSPDGPHYTFYNHTRRLLRHAELPTTWPLERLRVTGRRFPGILDDVDFTLEAEPWPVRRRRRVSRPTPPEPPPPAPISDAPPTGLTLRQFYESYYRGHFLAMRRKQHVPRPGRKHGTESIHETALKYFETHVGNLALVGLSGQAATRRLIELQTRLVTSPGFRESRLSRTTVNSIIQSIAGILHGAADLGWVQPPPRVPKLRIEEREVCTYSLTQLERLYDACEAAKWPKVDGVRAAYWWQALLVTMYATALRRGALVFASWSPAGVPRANLDRTERLLRVAGDKTVRSRLKPLRTEVFDHLDRLSDREEYLFPFPHSGREWRETRRRIWSDADVPALNGKPLHAIRATALTHVGLTFDGNVDAARMLADHASGRTTRAHYLSLAVQRAAVESLPWPSNWYTDTDAGDEPGYVIPFTA